MMRPPLGFTNNLLNRPGSPAPPWKRPPDSPRTIAAAGPYGRVASLGRLIPFFVPFLRHENEHEKNLVGYDLVTAAYLCREYTWRYGTGIALFPPEGRGAASTHTTLASTVLLRRGQDSSRRPLPPGCPTHVVYAATHTARKYPTGGERTVRRCAPGPLLSRGELSVGVCPAVLDR